MSRVCLVFLLAGFVWHPGCHYPVRENVDAVICELALQPRDLQPIEHAAATTSSPDGTLSTCQLSTLSSSTTIDPVSWKNRANAPDATPPKLNIPEALHPGGPVPPIRIPTPNDKNREQREAAITKLYPPLSGLGEDPTDPPGSEGKPLSLSDLQHLALTNSPDLKQATARVEEAKGLAIQAGLMPNPILGFEADTIGTTGGAGYVGGFLEQTIKTANKLQLSRAAAVLQVKLAELELVRLQAELATKVRTGYYSVLVAQESIRLNRALVRFFTEVYNQQVEMVRKGGFAAPYEPMFLRAIATEARAALIQARNRKVAAWKQLAASMGLPGLPPTEVVGRLDVAIPAYQYNEVLARVLTTHTNVRSALVEIHQAQLELELARRTPIPDVNVRVMLQKDRTAPPFQNSPSVSVGVPLPVWDHNQGNIVSAEAALVRVTENLHKARQDLTSRLAEAFERYENNRVILGYYRDQILPDLVRVYRGVYDRYQQDPGGRGESPPSFTDVIVAQQNLAQAVSSYITTLGNLWQAVIDVADILQTFDLFGVHTPTDAVAEIPDLEKLLALPCVHPCSPLPHAHQKVIDRTWPQAERGATALPPPTSALPPPKKVEPENQPKPDRSPSKTSSTVPILLPPLE